MTEPPVKLLLSTCPYTLLRYCDNHVIHFPFDAKMTDMVAHRFGYHILRAICGLFLVHLRWNLTSRGTCSSILTQINVFVLGSI